MKCEFNNERSKKRMVEMDEQEIFVKFQISEFIIHGNEDVIYRI